MQFLWGPLEKSTMVMFRAESCRRTCCLIFLEFISNCHLKAQGVFRYFGGPMAIPGPSLVPPVTVRCLGWDGVNVNYVFVKVY